MKQKKQKCRRKRTYGDEDWADDSFKLARTALGISVASKIIKDL